MKVLFLLLLAIFLLTIRGIGQDRLHPQTDSLSTSVKQNNKTNSEQDDEFNLFLFALAAAFLGLILGAALIGGLTATFIILLLGLFSTLGIISIAVFTGLYKRSASAVFKTLLYIICPIAGMVIGIAGIWIISLLFHLQLNHQTIVITGLTGGFIGGLLMAYTTGKISVILFRFFTKKLNPYHSHH